MPIFPLELRCLPNKSNQQRLLFIRRLANAIKYARKQAFSKLVGLEYVTVCADILNAWGVSIWFVMLSRQTHNKQTTNNKLIDDYEDDVTATNHQNQISRKIQTISGAVIPWHRLTHLFRRKTVAKDKRTPVEIIDRPNKINIFPLKALSEQSSVNCRSTLIGFLINSFRN